MKEISKPLKNARHEAFCQNLVNGVKPAKKEVLAKRITAKDAYIASGYKARGNAAEVNACRMLRKAQTKQRVSYLREKQAQRLAERGIATKDECCRILTSMIRTTLADFCTAGDDGVTFFDFGENTINKSALKKIKTRILRDEHGNTITERQFDEVELESKISAVKQLADMLGFNVSDDNDEKRINVYKEFLDEIRAQDTQEPTPQTG